jgi:hypothetical protein
MFENNWGVYGYQSHKLGMFTCTVCTPKENIDLPDVSEVNSDTRWAIDDEDTQGLQELECYDCGKVLCVAYVRYTNEQNLCSNLPDLDLLNKAFELLVEAGQATTEWVYLNIPKELV